MHLLQHRRGAVDVATLAGRENILADIDARLSWTRWMLGLNIVLNSAILWRLLSR